MARQSPAMSEYLIEPSEENDRLARAEIEGALEALGGSHAPAASIAIPGTVPVELADDPMARRLASRVALGRRILKPWPEREAAALEHRLIREASPGGTAAFRRWGHSTAGSDPDIEFLATVWRRAGGRIDLARPARRFFFTRPGREDWWFAEEIAAVDRQAYTARRMPNLPFRRPVSLAPRLARAAANLAGIREGDRVVDPFVGTGALLIEAGLLGGRLIGVDQDPEMIRGAIRNLRHLGLEADELVVADAADALRRLDPAPFDAILTDPPYGRASASRGEDPAALVARVLPTYAERLKPNGRLVAILPGGDDPVGPPWERVAAVPDRVHRSLTREFRVYARSASGRPRSGPIS